VAPVTRAVVLAAGLGTRMRKAGDAPLTEEQARAAAAGHKAMMPFGRPFLDHLLHNLAEAGVTRACLVTAPAHEEVRAYYRALPTSRLSIECTIQPSPRGTADAVAAAGAFLSDAAALVVNGDNLYPVRALGALVTGGVPALVGYSRSGMLSSGQIPPERIEKFALVVSRDGWMDRVIEKPDAATLAAAGADPQVSMNCWVVPPEILDVIRTLPLSPRGELELPMAVEGLVARGIRFRVVPCHEPVLDLSQRGDVAGVGAVLEGREVRL
jgi:glucose-1-phosphate thymidylyltransferase